MADQIYINSLTGKRSKYGIRISGKAEEVIAEIRKHSNDKGYINLEVKEMRQEGKNGKTHYVILDTYNSRDQQPSEQPAPAPPASQQGWSAQPSQPAEETDDLPF